ncbi:MAG: DinB family protein [Bacteroidota bacterium]
MEVHQKLSQRLDVVTQTIRERLASLPPETLTKRAEPGQWTAIECVDHLSLTNKAYFSSLERATGENYKATFWERNSPFSKSIGQNMVRTLGKDMTGKFKTPRLFHPRKSKDVKSVFEDFFKQQEKLVAFLDKLEGSPLKSRIVTSPVSGLITFSIEDLLCMVVGHQERHLEQAMKSIGK